MLIQFRLFNFSESDSDSDVEEDELFKGRLDEEEKVMNNVLILY